MLSMTNKMAETIHPKVLNYFMNKTDLLYITLENSNQQVCKTLAESTLTTLPTAVPKLTYNSSCHSQMFYITGHVYYWLRFIFHPAGNYY